ncbi:Very-long-chain 3-oxoacyl-CoA reductase-B [Armadillidium vulgare]|nr:Very-long-chain 3-oxoacyl-CoA reductase-B [Armadillidium vulgare]
MAWTKYKYSKNGQMGRHIHDLINCNIMSATMMSKLVLDGMQRRERGLIINMSSIVHLFPSPYLLVYASLKQFLVSFSKGLAEETKENNVTVQCVIPGIVTTKFSGARKTNLLITTPESYVTASLRSTGLEVCSYGHLTHRLQVKCLYCVKWLCNMYLILKIRIIGKKLNVRKLVLDRTTYFFTSMSGHCDIYERRL